MRTKGKGREGRSERTVKIRKWRKKREENHEGSREREKVEIEEKKDRGKDDKGLEHEIIMKGGKAEELEGEIREGMQWFRRGNQGRRKTYRYIRNWEGR